MEDRYDETWPPGYEREVSEEPNDEVEAGPSLYDSEDAPRYPDPRRSPVFPGVVGALLIALLGVAVWWAVRTILLPSASQSVPTPAWTPATRPSPSLAVTSTPVLSAQTPTPEESSTGVVVPITVGQSVRVMGTDGQGISFRSGPGANYVRLDVLADGAELKVLEGPEVADGYTWWRLERADGTVGWAADDWLRSVVPTP